MTSGTGDGGGETGAGSGAFAAATAGAIAGGGGSGADVTAGGGETGCGTGTSSGAFAAATTGTIAGGGSGAFATATTGAIAGGGGSGGFATVTSGAGAGSGGGETGAGSGAFATATTGAIAGGGGSGVVAATTGAIAGGSGAGAFATTTPGAAGGGGAGGAGSGAFARTGAEATPGIRIRSTDPLRIDQRRLTVARHDERDPGRRNALAEHDRTLQVGDHAVPDRGHRREVREPRFGEIDDEGPARPDDPGREGRRGTHHDGDEDRGGFGGHLDALHDVASGVARVGRGRRARNRAGCDRCDEEPYYARHSVDVPRNPDSARAGQVAACTAWTFPSIGVPARACAGNVRANAIRFFTSKQIWRTSRPIVRST